MRLAHLLIAVTISLGGLILLAKNEASNMVIPCERENNCSFISRFKQTSYQMLQAVKNKVIPPVVNLHLIKIQVAKRYNPPTPEHNLKVKVKENKEIALPDLFTDYTNIFRVCVHEYKRPDFGNNANNDFPNVIGKISGTNVWAGKNIETSALKDLVPKIKGIILNKSSLDTNLVNKWNEMYKPAASVYPVGNCIDQNNMIDKIRNTYHVVGLLSNYTTTLFNVGGEMFMDDDTKDGFIVYRENTQTVKHNRLYLKLIAHEFTHSFIGNGCGIHKNLKPRTMMSEMLKVEKCAENDKNGDGYDNACWNYSFRKDIKDKLKNVKEMPGRNFGKRLVKKDSEFVEQSISETIIEINSTNPDQVLILGEPVFVETEIIASEPLAANEVEKFLNASLIKVTVKEKINAEYRQTDEFVIPNSFRFVRSDNDSDRSTIFKAIIPVFTGGNRWMMFSKKNENLKEHDVKIEILIEDKYGDKRFPTIENNISFTKTENSNSIINNKLLLKLFLEENPEIYAEEDDSDISEIEILLDKDNLHPVLKENINTFYLLYKLKPKFRELIEPQKNLSKKRLDKVIDFQEKYFDNDNIVPKLHPHTSRNYIKNNRSIESIKMENRVFWSNRN